MEYFMAIDKKTGEVKEIWTSAKLRTYLQTCGEADLAEFFKAREIHSIDYETYNDELQERKLAALKEGLKRSSWTKRMLVWSAMLGAAQQKLEELDLPTEWLTYDPEFEYLLDTL